MLIKLILILLLPSLVLAEQNFSTKAKYVNVIDYNSSIVLFEKESTQLLYPASITKLMVAYLAFKNLKEEKIALNVYTKVSSNAYKKGHFTTGGSSMFLKQGQQVSVEDLIKGVIVISGNDASIALAELISGSEEAFIEEMNKTAKQLGLNDTNFTNVDGVHSNRHYSSAKDITTLAYHIIKDFNSYYEYFSMPEYTFNGVTQKNRNFLLSLTNDDNETSIVVDGLKTGHTDVSKYSLAFSAVKKEPNKSAFRIVGIVSGLASENERTAETKRIINWVYANYNQISLFKKGDLIAEVPVVNSNKTTLKLIALEDINILLPKRVKTSDIKAEITRLDYFVAPIKHTDVVANINITLPDGKYNRNYEIKLEEDIIAESFFVKFLLSPYYAIKKLFYSYYIS